MCVYFSCCREYSFWRELKYAGLLRIILAKCNTNYDAAYTTPSCYWAHHSRNMALKWFIWSNNHYYTNGLTTSQFMYRHRHTARIQRENYGKTGFFALILALRSFHLDIVIIIITLDCFDAYKGSSVYYIYIFVKPYLTRAKSCGAIHRAPYIILKC